MPRFSPTLTFVPIFCLGLLCPRTAGAHPIHRSIAEATFDAATRKLEVSLRVDVDDFETALSARAGKKISLEKTASGEFDLLAHAYVTETFTVKASDGTAPAFHWLGRELKSRENELWLFFELRFPDGIEGTKIRHAVMTGQFRDQLNSVIVRDGARKQTLFFLPTHGEKTVRFPP